jgi:hypothetical protein
MASTRLNVIAHHLERCRYHFDELDRLLKMEMEYEDYQHLYFLHIEDVNEALECGSFAVREGDCFSSSIVKKVEDLVASDET